MKDWKLYHGTSSQAYESIKKYGFVLGQLRYQNFLAPQGIYFCPDRPLIARRYAKKACRTDFSSETIVLEVAINYSRITKVLDLTADSGMNRFYKSYVKGKALLSTSNNAKLGEQIPDEYNDYLLSIHQAHEQVIKLLENANKNALKKPDSFNWDSLAIHLIVKEDGVQMVIAVVQEGTSFNQSFACKEPIYHSSPHYKGVRTRDHVQICIIDLSLIDLKNFRIRPIEHDLNEFDSDYINWVTNLDAPDVVSTS